jgi:hypothetical protein
VGCDSGGCEGKYRCPQERYENLFLSISKASIFLRPVSKKIIFTDVSREKVKQTKIFSNAREKKS